MSKRSFSFQLHVPQIHEALLAYARAMVDCSLHDVTIDVIDETLVDVVCTRKRARKAPAKKAS